MRAQLRALVDKAAGAAGAASSELQALLRESQSEAISLRSEVAALSTSLQSSNQEAQLLRSQIATLQAKCVGACRLVLCMLGSHALTPPPTHSRAQPTHASSRGLRAQRVEVCIVLTGDAYYPAHSAGSFCRRSNTSDDTGPMYMCVCVCVSSQVVSSRGCRAPGSYGCWRAQCSSRCHRNAGESVRGVQVQYRQVHSAHKPIGAS